MFPNPTDQINALIALYNQGRFLDAASQAEALLKRQPQALVLYEILGGASAGLGRIDVATGWYQKLLQQKPDHAEAHFCLGCIHHQQGRYDEAVASYRKALQSKRDHADALNNLAIAHELLGHHEESVAGFRKLLQLKPSHAPACYNMGIALTALGRREEAAACYRRAVQIQPDYAEAHNNLGSVLKEMGRGSEAIPSFERALALNPAYAEAHYNLGTTLAILGRHEEAAACFAEALRIKPDFVKAHKNLGSTLYELGRIDEAQASLSRAIQLMPSYAEARSERLYIEALICDWPAVASDLAALAAPEAEGRVEPFTMLALDDDPASQRQRAEQYAAAKFPVVERPAFARPAARPEKLRIGYFAATFHNHALMQLMAKFFASHDRTRFELHAFSYGPERNDTMRARMKDIADVFHDIRLVSDHDAAALAREQGIDIAIDLMGYTQNGRCGIFACRPAPVQISYLGFPGTLGAPFADYIVVDRMVVPAEQRQFYSENTITLPHSYYVTDDTREISPQPMTRADMGLPEQGFVFCCFNNTNKLRPPEFDIWIRLLRAVDGSVLWLLKSNDRAEANLRREAEKRGVAAERLVFAERVSPAEHLARHRLADLFLDTFIYNAHTTACDALWAGLPVLSKPGRSFASRVGASVLTATELSELIAETEERYESLALELARNPEALTAIRQKLARNRTTTALFDTEQFCRHFERGCTLAYERWFAGREPGDIMVEENLPIA